jgi:glycosyl transferase family 25
MPPIWAINLRRSTERRAHIIAQLDRLGLDYEIVEAVDGSKLGPDELAAWYCPSRAIALMGRELTTGEIGCSLSHLRLYQRQVEEGHEAVVILEDDAVVDPTFLEILGRRESLPQDWELVMLYGSPARISYWGARVFDSRHRCVKFASIAYGTLGYLLRRDGARKLLAHALPIRMAADHLTGGRIRTGVRLYGITPPCIRERLSSELDSTMPESHAVRERWPRRDELHPAIWPLHKAKWGLIHFYERCNPYRIV